MSPVMWTGLPRRSDGRFGSLGVGDQCPVACARRLTDRRSVIRGDGRVISIDVVDDGRPGRGPSDRRGSGFGIPGIKERAEMLGATSASPMQGGAGR